MTVRILLGTAEEEQLFLSPPFNSLTSEEQKNLARQVRLHAFTNEEILFVQGQDIRHVYFLLSGQVKLAASAAQGKECVLHIIRQNSFIDLCTLFYENGVPYSAVALSEGVAGIIDKNVIVSLMEANFPFAMRCMRIVSARQRLFINKLVGSQGRISVACRVSSWLLHRSRMEQSDELHFDFGRELMARLLGVTRESLSRELSRLAELGYIAVDRRNVTLFDKKALEKLANM